GAGQFGFINRAHGNFTGLAQVGLGNTVEESSAGSEEGRTDRFMGLAQVGVYNQTEKVLGLAQLGVANVSRGGGFRGIAHSGAFGAYARDVNGAFQLGSALAMTDDFHGAAQVGFVTISSRSTGAQLGGVAYVSEEHTGLQIGALVNYAKTAHGAQLGLINMSE